MALLQTLDRPADLGRLPLQLRESGQVGPLRRGKLLHPALDGAEPVGQLLGGAGDRRQGLGVDRGCRSGGTGLGGSSLERLQPAGKLAQPLLQRLGPATGRLGGRRTVGQRLDLLLERGQPASERLGARAQIAEVGLEAGEARRRIGRLPARLVPITRARHRGASQEAGNQGGKNAATPRGRLGRRGGLRRRRLRGPGRRPGRLVLGRRRHHGAAIVRVGGGTIGFVGPKGLVAGETRLVGRGRRLTRNRSAISPRASSPAASARHVVLPPVLLRRQRLVIDLRRAPLRTTTRAGYHGSAVRRKQGQKRALITLGRHSYVRPRQVAKLGRDVFAYGSGHDAGQAIQKACPADEIAPHSGRTW